MSGKGTFRQWSTHSSSIFLQYFSFRLHGLNLMKKRGFRKSENITLYKRFQKSRQHFARISLKTCQLCDHWVIFEACKPPRRQLISEAANLRKHYLYKRSDCSAVDTIPCRKGQKRTELQVNMPNIWLPHSKNVEKYTLIFASRILDEWFVCLL